MSAAYILIIAVITWAVVVAVRFWQMKGPLSAPSALHKLGWIDRLRLAYFLPIEFGDRLSPSDAEQLTSYRKTIYRLVFGWVVLPMIIFWLALWLIY